MTTYENAPTYNSSVNATAKNRRDMMWGACDCGQNETQAPDCYCFLEMIDDDHVHEFKHDASIDFFSKRLEDKSTQGYDLDVIVTPF
jgi:hypothetical protein